jgi:hypothetical protein
MRLGALSSPFSVFNLLPLGAAFVCVAYALVARKQFPSHNLVASASRDR